MLGGKALECFLWSAARDDDPEFLRRYGGTSERIAFMLRYESVPSAAEACARLRALID